MTFLERREIGQEVMELEDEADMAVAEVGQRRVPGPRQVLAQHGVLPARGLHQRPQNGQQRRLARARGAEQRRQVPFRQFQVQPLQHPRFRLAFPIGLDEIAHFDERTHCPITETGSTRAAARAGRMEARMAPTVVSAMARPNAPWRTSMGRPPAEMLSGGGKGDSAR